MEIIIIIIFSIFSSFLNAQTIQGTVWGRFDSFSTKKLNDSKSEKEPLSGAKIIWIDTQIGTLSNENGDFTISSQNIIDQRLVISYIGFYSDTILIKDTVFSVILKAKETTTEETEINSEKPVQIEKISSLDLTKTACCDLAGCFETQGTIQPQTTNVLTNSKELRIFGLPGVYNQILFDGIPMFQGLASTYGISSYPGTLVENIFVAKGANSVLQGFESITGQINVVPKMPNQTDKLLLNVYTNSFLEKHANANFATSMGKKKKISTLLAFHTVQPAQKTDKDKDNFLDLPQLTRYMIYNRWQFGIEQHYGFYSHMGLRFVNEQRIGGQMNFDKNQKGSTSIYGQTVNYFQPEIYTKTGLRIDDYNNFVFTGSFQIHEQDSYFGSLHYVGKQKNAYLNLQHELIWKNNHVLKYGLSHRFQQVEENISFLDTTISRNYNGKYNTNWNVPGIFAENVFHWKQDKWVWVVGARLDKSIFKYHFSPKSILKYKPKENHTFRASLGTGWRQINLFSENINLLASSRNVIFEDKINPEEALNWGLNYSLNFKNKKNFSGTLGLDFYQTRFFNQFFPDYDSDPTKAFIRNFTQKSISNAFQLELTLRFYKVLEIKSVYNFLEVYRNENKSKFILPFNAKNRLVLAISYRPKNDKWYFDINFHAFDKQRLPSTSLNPEEFQKPDFSKPYSLTNVQITYKWKNFDFYGGCENIFNFRQNQPIISWQNPYSQYFDTSSVWGPTRGREVYFGIRWKIKKKI